MLILIASVLSSLLGTLWIIKNNHLHRHLSSDNVSAEPQKFHTKEVPRIGGLAIYLALILSSIIRYFQDQSSGITLLTLTACALPVFLIGFLEDITKKIGIIARLTGISVGALVACLYLDASIQNIGLPLLQYILSHYAISLTFTIFAIVGLSNAYNIIDGFHGLSSMIGIIALASIAYVGFRVNDVAIITCSVAMIGAILGFFIFNYPNGLIFLGDGGAYLIGFWVAMLSILLVGNNPTISPWYAILTNIYPILETLFTIWRRFVHQGKNPGIADGIHFHSLIYRRVLCQKKINAEIKSLNKIDFNHLANIKTSPHLWTLSALATLPSLIFWSNGLILFIFTICFCALYIYLYSQIVRFKTPGWLRIF
jgi:UDP-N-acetylmuramyl pentapeptide phosphotransferase/UDP-N-acetylglucosamine-1-phosphate transferase